MEYNLINIVISIENQSLELFDANRCIKKYTVSTARNGPGQLYGSECTPLGHHIIRAKIGKDAPINTVFVSRRPTGEIYSSELSEKFPGRDWILTRICWLSGCEPGLNRFGQVDTMMRKIYIHGSPDSCKMGVPGSRGCIRMYNEDLVELFNLVEPGTKVLIK